MMNKIINVVLPIIIAMVLTVLFVKSCDAEYENDLNKQRQWVQDSKDGKAFTNYGE